MAQLKLPFSFPPAMEKLPSDQVQENFEQVRQFVQDLNDAVETLTNLTVTGTVTGQTAVVGGTVTGTTVTGSTAVVGGTLAGTNATVTGTLTNTNKLTTDSNGNVNQPNQPSFLVVQIVGGGTNQTGNLDPYVWSTEQYDVGGNFASNVFTAPITGKYYFSFVCNVSARAGTPVTVFQPQLVTSNQTYKQLSFADVTTLLGVPCGFSATVDMDASDTANIKMVVPGAGSTWSSDGTLSFFTGTLIN